MDISREIHTQMERIATVLEADLAWRQECRDVRMQEDMQGVEHQLAIRPYLQLGPEGAAKRLELLDGVLVGMHSYTFDDVVIHLQDALQGSSKVQIQSILSTVIREHGADLKIQKKGDRVLVPAGTDRKSAKFAIRWAGNYMGVIRYLFDRNVD